MKSYSVDPKHGTSCAPSVLIYFINMMLMKEAEPATGCDPYMFDFQQTLQYILVACAVVCIPVLLLGKPLFIKSTRKHKPQIKSNGDVVLNQGIELTDMPESQQIHESNGHHVGSGGGAVVGEEEEEEPMSEVFIHQGIHTIEYVLSTVSHTASYLRLWALSLAHAR